jgi:predicted RNase H-like HicB family nuclease
VDEGYQVILEPGETNWSAYSPDVDGCIATGETREECLHNFAEALEFHFEGLREDGLSLPEPRSVVGHVRIAA